MKHGFVKVAAIASDVKIADIAYNTGMILRKMDELERDEVQVLVFPELCITGAGCGSLFQKRAFLQDAKYALQEIAAHTAGKNYICFVGLPYSYAGSVYNVAAAVADGRVLGLVPQGKSITAEQAGYGFVAGCKGAMPAAIDETETVPMGQKLIFTCAQLPMLRIGVEVGQDIWSAMHPGINHVQAGANLNVALTADPQLVGRDAVRKDLLSGESRRLHCGYIYANAGNGEATDTSVCCGHNLIVEQGTILAESQRFMNESVVSEIDLMQIEADRSRAEAEKSKADGYTEITFDLKEISTRLTRTIKTEAFVPADRRALSDRCGEIFLLQAMALKQKMLDMEPDVVVITLTDHVESVLSFLTAVYAVALTGGRRARPVVVKQGSWEADTSRELDDMLEALGVTAVELPVTEGSILYVDHVCMTDLMQGKCCDEVDKETHYAVNRAVPKTLIMYMLQVGAQMCGLDFIPMWEEVEQDTEAGPYEVQDFILYHMLRYGATPSRIYRLAVAAYENKYDAQGIRDWIRAFYDRFFTSVPGRMMQPEGPVIGAAAVSSLNGWAEPTEDVIADWKDELEHLEVEVKEQKAAFDLFSTDWEDFAKMFQ